MNIATKERIVVIKANDYPLDFGRVFDHAFENYKKIALYAGLMIFVFLILFSVVISGVLLLAVDETFLKEIFEKMKPENLKTEMLNINFMMINLGITIFITCLISPLTAGFIKMAHCAERDTEFHVSTVFEYFKPPYFKELFMATFIITLISSGTSTLFEIANLPLVGFIFSILIWLFTFLTIPLIILGNLKATEAIKSSIVIAIKQPLILISLLLISVIVVLVGLFGFCIGLFFTYPFIYSMYYAIYCEIIGIDFKSELDENGSDVAL